MSNVSRRRMARIGSAIRGGIVALSIVVCALSPSAHAQETGSLPKIEDIRLVRKLGDNVQAMEYVRTLLADREASAEVRREAYNEMVAIAYAAEGADSARSAAWKALTEYPDLSMDAVNYPAEIRGLYDDLRKEMFGRLRLTSDPSDCAVSIDGREIGSTPIEGKYLPAGGYVLLLKKADYSDDTIHVEIAAGSEQKRFVAMRLLRESMKRRIGFEASLSSVSMKYEGGTGGTDGSDSDLRFGGGIFLQTYAQDRLAFQIGARYSSQGSTSLTLTYVAFPALMKLYPFAAAKLFGCLGVEPAYLLAASYEDSESGESTDILEHTNRVQVSLVVGAGYEISLGEHYMGISIYRILGEVSLRDETNYEMPDSWPREWRIGISFLI